MLESLNLINFGLIKSLYVDFHKNFNCIIGESGSGKSHIIKALNLIKGAAASTKYMGIYDTKTTIQAAFCIKNIPHLVKELDCHQLIITRKLFKDKPSKIFLNDELISLKTLEKLSQELLFISSQDQQRFMTQSHFLLGLYDKFCGDETLALNRAYNKTYNALCEHKKQNTSLPATHQLLIKQLQESIDELQAAQVLDNEEAILKAEKKQLEGKQARLKQLAIFLQDIEQLDEQILRLQQQQGWLEDQEAYTSFLKQLETMQTHNQEASLALKKEANELECLDMDRLNEIETRLNDLFSLSFKYKPGPTESLSDMLQNIVNEHQELKTKQEAALIFNEKTRQLEQDCQQIANQLHHSRLKHQKPFEELMIQSCQNLGLEKLKFSLNLKPTENLHPLGQSHLSFLFSANPDQALEPLNRCASGGESSRLLLALYNALLSKKPNLLLVLDEIDQGVSGQTALQLGQHLAQSSQINQLICISHVEQVALHASQLLLVNKTFFDNQTQVTIEQNVSTEHMHTHFRGQYAKTI